MEARHTQPRPRKTIPFRSVDLEDRTFVITFAPDLGALKESLARVGMIHPPLVQTVSPDGRYRVISGYRRILAARELGWDRLGVELASAEEKDLDLFLRALDENLGTRSLNVMEKVLALDKLRNQFGLTEEEVLSRHLPRLGLGSDRKTLALYLSLAGLEEEIRRGLVADELSRTVAHRLTKRTPQERLTFFRLAHRLRPGKNLQRELFDLLTDIGRREKIAVDDLLAEDEIASLIENDDVPAPQRLKTVREILLRHRYPRFSRVVDRYEQLRRQFRLPPRTTLSPPPHFEGRDWRLAITFRSREELEQADRTLRELIDHPLLDRLLDLPPEEEEGD
jgi:ParB family chromosome partitioning protein